MSVLVSLVEEEQAVLVAAQPHYGEWDWSNPTDQELWENRGQGFYIGPLFTLNNLGIAAAAQALYGGEWFWFAEDTEDYQADTSLDVTPAFFPPAAGVPDEIIAATQDYTDDFLFVAEETDDYAVLPEQLEFLADTPVETIATQPLAEQYLWGADEPEDYLAPPEQLEFLAPPEIVVPELIAAQPQPEVEWTQTELEDYANDSALDVTPQLFPPVVAEPIETFAAQPLAEQAWFADTELEDYQAAPEQLEFLAPPEIAVTELTVQAQLFEQPWYPDQETEDYGPDATVEAPALYPPTAAEPVETFAAQALYGGEWVWEDQQTEDYPSDVEVAWFFSVPLEAIIGGHDFAPEVPEADTLEDYQHTSTLDVSPLTLQPFTIAELIPSYTTWHDLVDSLTAETLEDYQHTSTIELVALFAAPAPSPTFITEGDADALAGVASGSSVAASLEGDADAATGRESDDSKASSIEGDVLTVASLES